MHFSNPSQLILRNSERLECQQLLMVGMPADHLATALLSDNIAKQITGLSRDFSDVRQMHREWEDQPALSLSYAPVFDHPNGQSFDGILLFLQKSKPLMDFWLLMAQSLLAENGTLWLVGENSEGIKSWKKRLKNSFSVVTAVDNARHCVLLEASESLQTASGFDMNQHWQTFAAEFQDSTLPIYSLPGVFSHGRLDVGTRVLLDTFDTLPEGRVLDFGCGAGVISACIQQMQGQRTLTLVDCDALALRSSRKTLSALQVDSFEVIASDGLSEVEGSFDLIISNPPFHQGVKTHYVVTEQFLANSLRFLKPGGELRIVANSFLKYPPIIKSTFGHCETLLRRDGFSVYKAICR